MHEKVQKELWKIKLLIDECSITQGGVSDSLFPYLAQYILYHPESDSPMN